MGKKLEEVIQYLEKNIAEEEERAYDGICHTYKFFEKDTAFHPYEASPITWMFTMVGEYLRSFRIKQGLTQETPSEGACAVETWLPIDIMQASEEEIAAVLMTNGGDFVGFFLLRRTYK